MTESLPEFLYRDLRRALVEGAARHASRSRDGERWLLRAAALTGGVAFAMALAAGYHAGFLTLNQWSSAYPPWLWQALTLLGDEHLAFALTLFFARRSPRLFWTLICAALIATAYARGLKPLIDAARPPAVLDPGSFQLIGPAHRHASFPSGHSVTAAVWFGVLIYHARWIEWRLLFLLLALLAGLSRVALGVHWPVDVAAGLAGGFASVVAGAWLARRWDWGLVDVSMHLALVTLAGILATALLIADRGYPDVAEALRLVAGLALTAAAWSYLIEPGWRWWRGP